MSVSLEASIHRLRNAPGVVGSSPTTVMDTNTTNTASTSRNSLSSATSLASSPNNSLNCGVSIGESATPRKANVDTSSCSSGSEPFATSSPKTPGGGGTPESKKKKRSPKSYRAPLPNVKKPSQASSGLVLDLPTVSITEPAKESTPDNVEVIELETFTKEGRSLTTSSFSSISSSNTTASSSSTSNNKLSPVSKIGVVDEGAESDIEPSSGSMSSHVERSSIDSKKPKKKRRFKSLNIGKTKIGFEKSGQCKEAATSTYTDNKGDGEQGRHDHKRNDAKIAGNSPSISGCSMSSANDSPPLVKHVVAESSKSDTNNTDVAAGNNKMSLLFPSYRGHLQYFRKLFAAEIGTEAVGQEMLVDEFHCALLNKILLQGKMYLSLNYVCFYSNLLVHETRIALPYTQIKAITKANLLKFIPNAIEIRTQDGREYFIGSFINRDQAFDYITKLWRSAQGGQKLSWRTEVCPIIKNSYTTDTLYYELEQGEKVDLTLKKSKKLKRLSSQSSQTCVEEEETAASPATPALDAAEVSVTDGGARQQCPIPPPRHHRHRSVGTGTESSVTTSMWWWWWSSWSLPSVTPQTLQKAIFVFLMVLTAAFLLWGYYVALPNMRSLHHELSHLIAENIRLRAWVMQHFSKMLNQSTAIDHWSKDQCPISNLAGISDGDQCPPSQLPGISDEAK